MTQPPCLWQIHNFIATPDGSQQSAHKPSVMKSSNSILLNKNRVPLHIHVPSLFLELFVDPFIYPCRAADSIQHEYFTSLPPGLTNKGINRFKTLWQKDVRKILSTTKLKIAFCVMFWQFLHPRWWTCKPLCVMYSCDWGGQRHWRLNTKSLFWL